MKISPMVNFKARFDRNRANNIYLQNAYNNAEATGRTYDYSEAKGIFDNLPDYSINVVVTTSGKDVFKVDGRRLHAPLEIGIPKKQGSESPSLDTFVGLSRIMKQLLS